MTTRAQAPSATLLRSDRAGLVATLLTIVTLAIGATAMSGCVPLVVAGAAGGTALVATDRRSTGAQVDDEGVELKLLDQISRTQGDKVHVNVTSYNGNVLLTGEAPNAATVAAIGAAARTTDKVKTVHNEIVVAPLTDLGQRTNDTYITSKVKSRFIEANRFPPNAVKVVTERGVVYLLGIVNRSEGELAGETAATTTGVLKVVKVFEYR